MSDWHETARALKAADPERTNESIGRELGVTKSAVYKALHPEKTRQWNRRDNSARGHRKRAWDWQHRLTCSRCGEQMCMGSARADGTRSEAVRGDVCKACRTTIRAERAMRMVALRGEGKDNRDIGAALGVPANTVAQELCRLRALGFDVPVSPYAASRGARPHAKAMTVDAGHLGRALEAHGIAVPAFQMEQAA